MKLRRDPRLRHLRWRDLLQLSRGDVAAELLLSAPWLAASLCLAQARCYPLALAASFLFFLTGLRQGLDRIAPELASHSVF